MSVETAKNRLRDFAVMNETPFTISRAALVTGYSMSCVSRNLAVLKKEGFVREIETGTRFKSFVVEKEILPKKMEQLTERVFTEIQNQNFVSKEIAEKLKCSVDRVYRCLKVLERRGRVEVIVKKNGKITVARLPKYDAIPEVSNV